MILQKWNEIELSTALHLPPPNEFIPENFNLYPIDENVCYFDLKAYSILNSEDPLLACCHQ